WGSNAGRSDNPLDLIFLLGMAMGLVTVLLVNPIIYNLFTIKRRGKIANKKFHERTVLEGCLYFLSEILKSFFINILIFLTYQVLNQTLIKLLNLGVESVPVPGEPLLYACLYVLFLALINGIIDKIYNIFQKEVS
ncbi:MAG TPA: hypothetical protein VIK96_01755, partial [Bacilli bacterium]